LHHCGENFANLIKVSLSLFMSLGVFVTFIGGIIGQSLAPYASLSTLSPFLCRVFVDCQSAFEIFVG
jgi:hypothetical protein